MSDLLTASVPDAALDDRSIVRRMATGDRAAFELLMRRSARRENVIPMINDRNGASLAGPAGS